MRECFEEFGNGENYKISSNALESLQEATEQYMIESFKDSQYAAIHAKRRVVRVDDLRLVRRIISKSSNGSSIHKMHNFKFNTF